MKTCFICNSQCISYFNPEVEVTSYTGKSIFDIFSQITNLIPVNFDYICQSCMIKCNEFDEHSTKAQEISKLFLDYIQEPRTEIKKEIDDSDTDVCIIEKEPLIECKVENPNEEEEVFAYQFLENPELNFSKFLKEPHDDSELGERQSQYIKDIQNQNEFLIKEKDSENFNGDKKQNLKCNKCGKFFNSKNNLKAHLKSHQQPPKQNYPIRLPKTNEIKEFPCTFPGCPWSFETKFRLQYHLAVHSDERNYKCSDCGKAFKTQNILNGHKRIHEPDYIPKSNKNYVKRGRPKPKPEIVQCDLCGLDIKRKYFIDHFRITHRPTRPHLCSTCGKGFNSRSNLRNHQAVHADEQSKKIICDFCGKRFFAKQRLTPHMKMLHMKLEKKEECQFCRKKFHTKHVMRTHVRVVHLHKMEGYVPTAIDVVCNICGKLFDQKRSLIKHMDRVHDSTPLN